MATKKPKRGIDLEERPIVKSTGKRRSQKFNDFLENLVTKRMSEREAALKAGFSMAVANNTKAKIWKKKQAQEVWDEIIANTVDPDMLRRNILLGLNANKVSYIGKDGRPEIDVDIAERREWTKLVRRWSGIKDDKLDQSDNKGVIINFIDDMN